MNQDAVFQQAGLAHFFCRYDHLVRGHGVLSVGDQIQESFGRGRHPNHHRHLDQAHLGVPQQEALHQGLRSLRAFARSHAAVRFINHHIEAVRNSPRSVGQRFPNQMLPSIAAVGQRLIDRQLLGVDEIDTPAVQPGRVEMCIDGDELVDPIHLVRFALDLELGLLVELGHVRHPQDDGIGLRRPIQRPGQLVIGLIQNRLEQRRHHDGLAAARSGREGHDLLVIRRHALAGAHQGIAQFAQRVFLKIEQRDLHARAPCVPAGPAARS